jgi:hypothetical protein
MGREFSIPVELSDPLGSGLNIDCELSEGKFAMKILNLPLRGLCLAVLDLAWAFRSNRSKIWFPIQMPTEEPIGRNEPFIMFLFQVSSLA